MKIHFISTINGLENEGMRNVATHLSKEFEKEHTVTYSKLKDIFSIIKNGRKSDVTLIFARLIKSVYFLLFLVRPFLKKICVVCVQPVSDEFARLNKKYSVVDCCLTICKEDVENAFDNSLVYVFSVGINKEKFKAENVDREMLCEKLKLPKDKKIVLHVGHCSSGRFLEEMNLLDKNIYYPVVIASGMFNDENTVRALKDGGVDLRFGFVKNIEDFYRCADVYFFPTKTSDYVISVPLSVMEALSCGTPVVAYNSFKKLSLIKTNSEKAVTYIETVKYLSEAVSKAENNKQSVSYLYNPQSWEQVKDEITVILEKLRSKL